MPAEKIKPCPFCGSSKIKFLKHSSPYPAARYGVCIKCNDCGARSGLYLKEENVITNWNRRADTLESACQHSTNNRSRKCRTPSLCLSCGNSCKSKNWVAGCLRFSAAHPAVR
jgi:Lar family restriction alleviation protein